MPSTGSWGSIPICPLRAPSEPSTVAAVIEPRASGSEPASCAVRPWFHSSCLPPPRARSSPRPPLGFMGSLATLGASSVFSSGDVLPDFPPRAFIGLPNSSIHKLRQRRLAFALFRDRSAALKAGNAEHLPPHLLRSSGRG